MFGLSRSLECVGALYPMTKEHGIVYPSGAVHISTLPLKLYSKLKNVKPSPKTGNEADSGSTQTAVLRGKTKESFKFKESNNSPFKNHTFQVILIEEGMGNFKDRFFYTKEALQKAAQSKIFEGIQCYADHPTEIEEQVQPERSTRDILGYYENIQYEESDDGTGTLVANLCIGNSISLDWAMSLLTNSIDYSTKFRESDLVGLSINASGSASQVEIDAFLQSQKLSPSVIEKLNEAKTQGISEINIVNELTQAQSVDLVTKAGAGGKILRMLEMEKSMGKTRKFFESEGESEKHEKHHEDGAADASAMAPGSAGKPDHADEDQDKALFAKMIKQYLGKDDADQEEMEMAKHAYQAHKEGGMEHGEAYEAAGKHLKMAMEIGKKMAQCKQASESEHEAESEAEKKEAQSPPPAPKGDGPAAKKESDYIQLHGEVARLKESVKQYELRDYLDSKMRESKRSNAFTKKFREALGTPKSKPHIDEMWKIFLKAADAGVEEVGTESDVFLTEKSNYRESESSTGKVNFSDCLR